MKAEELYNAAGPFLRPLGSAYALLMKARRALYENGTAAAYRPAAPAVSVGNIAFGGTGKSPFIDFLLAWAEEKKLKAAVLSRGYGGKPGPEPIFVGPKTAPALCGDEPLMLARKHPKAVIAVHPKRAKSAKAAERLHRPDIFFLDDGMQHLAAERDLNIVLLRPEDFGKDWNRVIPSGPWREGAEALNSASAFAVKTDAKNFAALAPLIQKRIGHLQKPVFSFTLEASGLVSADGSARMPAEECLGRGYGLFCGVGNPEQVVGTATRLMGGTPAFTKFFPDHHNYTAADAEALRQSVAPGQLLLCTAKDAVKPAIAGTGAWVLEISLHFGSALFTEQTFIEWWESVPLIRNLLESRNAS